MPCAVVRQFYGASTVCPLAFARHPHDETFIRGRLHTPSARSPKCDKTHTTANAWNVLHWLSPLGDIMRMRWAHSSFTLLCMGRFWKVKYDITRPFTLLNALTLTSNHLTLSSTKQACLLPIIVFKTVTSSSGESSQVLFESSENLLRNVW